MRARSSVYGGLVLLGLLGFPGCGSTSSPSPSVTASAPKPSSVTVLRSGVDVSRDRVDVALRLRQPANVDPPLARSARLDVGGVGAWRGGALAVCSIATLEARGPAACPAASILGHGQAIGVADASRTVGTITVVSGGPRRILLATLVRHPAYVKTVIEGTVIPRGDGVRIALTFPEDLQVIAGVPVGLQQLRLTLNRRTLVAAGACPAAGGWHYAAEVSFSDGTRVARRGAATCTDR
jgi:hypothetical protein